MSIHIFKLIYAGIASMLLLSCSSNIKNYQKITTELKKHDQKIDVPEMYTIENFSDINTLKKSTSIYTPERGKGKGYIWALKTKDNLVIIIETDDQGHAGEYGVVYSENGQIPVLGEWTKEWSIDEKINNNWWNISYQLE